MYQRDLFDPPKIWVAELDWEKVLEYYSLSDSLQVLTTEDILTTIITLIVSCTCNYVCVCVYTYIYIYIYTFYIYMHMCKMYNYT